MGRSIAARVERLEPRAEAAWRRAWQTYAERVETAIPDAVLEQATTVPNDEDAWLAFQAEHGIRDVMAWGDQHDAIPITIDAPDYRRWPHTIPEPPPEPEGAWERMHQLRADDGSVGAFASLAVLMLGLARCVREARS
jgi:hypothetical protein